MSEEEIKPVHTGKLWKNDSFYQTFEEAELKRQKLLQVWKDNEEHKGMQVKVKRLTSRNQFVVKTRLHPDVPSLLKRKRRMSNVAKKIKEIMREENMTLKEVIKKYPHLAEMHLEEFVIDEELSEIKEKNKKLLLD